MVPTSCAPDVRPDRRRETRLRARWVRATVGAMRSRASCSGRRWRSPRSWPRVAAMRARPRRPPAAACGSGKPAGGGLLVAGSGAATGSGSAPGSGSGSASGSGSGSASGSGQRDHAERRGRRGGLGAADRRRGQRAPARRRAVAADGTAVVVGVFKGTTTFGAIGEMTSAGEEDGFITAIATDGTVRWSRQLGGPRADVASGVAIAGGVVGGGRQLHQLDHVRRPDRQVGWLRTICSSSRSTWRPAPRAGCGPAAASTPTAAPTSPRRPMAAGS
jgi:hypothetical protein